MKLLVLGATGGIGRAVVDQLLERGHQVTAFVRSPEKVARRHERLSVVGGAPQDPDALARTLAAHDAMVSALGPRSRKDDCLLPDCTQSMIEAMHRTGVRRLLTVSTGLLFPNVGLLGLAFRRLLHRTLRGAAQAERERSRRQKRQKSRGQKVRMIEAKKHRARHKAGRGRVGGDW